MKSVVKAVGAVPNPNQLALDFDGRAAEPAEKQKTAPAKAPRIRKAPTGVDIPEKPGGR